MTDEIVTRLYRCLVEELRSRGYSGDQPVKASEIYQDLVPYRAVRSALGVELNADYEHALLRLLAGERDLIRLEPGTAREELRREVDAPYPFVGLFRKYSASDVWVSMPAERVESRPATPSANAPAPVATTPATVPDSTAPAAPPAAPTPLRTEPPVPAQRIAAEAEDPPLRLGGRGGPLPARVAAPVHIHRESPDPASDPAERLTRVGADCVFCAEDLPAGRRIRFCPHCGGDQRLRPCPRCEAVLEREWRYCISCGHEVPGTR